MHVHEATAPGEDSAHASRFAPSVHNAHARVLHASIEQVRPWIAACWTGTDRDPFPRDFIQSWRENPPGEDPLALVPNITRLGHGVFSFRFVSWDGEHFRLRVESPGYRGWHGFDLRAVGDACEVTHTLEFELSGRARVVWPVFFTPIHDWCVEAILDRIEVAARTGIMPERTLRPLPWAAALPLATFRLLLSRSGHRRRRAESVS